MAREQGTNPTAQPNPRYGERVDLFMSKEEHDEIRQSIIQNAAYLALSFMPDVVSTHLDTIPLNHRVPLSLRSTVGDRYTHMTYQADHYPEPQDPRVDIWLVGRQQPHQMQITSDSRQQAEMGLNKQFLLRPKDVEKPTGSIACGDLCFLLDESIPHERIGRLADPRDALTFGEIANGMTELLAPIARRITTKRVYRAHDERLAAVPGGAQIFESHAALQESRTGNTTQYELSLTAPLDLTAGRIIKRVTYAFERRDHRGKGLDMSVVDSEVKVSLGSSDLPKEVVRGYLGGAQENTDGYEISRRALEMLLDRRVYPSAG